MQDFYKELGRLVREKRKAILPNQAALATKVGLSRTSITNIESGRQHVSLHMLYELAGALKVEPSALLPDKSFLRKGMILQLDVRHITPNLAQTVEKLYAQGAVKGQRRKIYGSNKKS